jgi:hypothetical protein
MQKQTGMRLIIIILVALLLGGTAVATAQSEERGNIQGMVYEDIDGDGLCIDTGVEGEDPLGGIDVEFTSSDEETVITLYSGNEGIFGLFAAGQSYWKVEAKPPEGYVVTSENPLYAPVFPADGLSQTGYNFCVSTNENAAKADAANQAVIVLPQSGAPATAAANTWVWGILAAGLLFVFVGLGITLQQRGSRS